MSSIRVLLLLLVTVSLHLSACANNCVPEEKLPMGWVLHPETVQAEIGDNIDFSCLYVNPITNFSERAATLWQHFTLTGRRDGIIESVPARNFTFDASTNGSLVITHVTNYHAGMYGCVFTSCGLSTISDNATLLILSKPNIELDKSEFPSESETVLIITGRVIGHPTPMFTLSRMDGRSIDMSRFIITFISFQLSIRISRPKVADEGTYRLEATNEKGSSDIEFMINIVGPDVPYVSVPEVVVANFNKSVSINCSVIPTARDNLILSWRGPNNDVIPESGSMRVIHGETSIVLMIDNLNSGSKGSYRCNATNSRSNDEGISIVESPPIFLNDDVTVTGTGRETALTWSDPTASAAVLGQLVAFRVFISRAGKLIHTANVSVEDANVYQIEGLEPGDYSVTIATVVNDSLGNTIVGPQSTPKYFVIEPTVQTPTTPTFIPIVAALAGVVLIIIIVIVIIIFCCCICYSHRQQMNSQQRNWNKDDELDSNGVLNQYSTLQLPPLAELPPSPDSPIVSLFSTEIDPSWEFPREDLQLTETLYEGPYTMLYKGVVMGVDKKMFDVSVKAMKDNAMEDDMKVMIAEMELLAGLGQHPNIVSLLSVCTVDKPLSMVLEYMCHGDLLGFLRASRGHLGMYTIKPGIRSQPPMLRLTSRDILSIAAKIANGMRFLADRKIAHRALCARNVLVGTSMEIKIYNVGAFDIPFEYRDVLVKWMAPETLFDGTTSPYSDVWSFGVTLWELVTLGGTPYAEILSSDLYSQLLGGMRMPKPPHCSQEVYDIMRRCWELNPTDRPYFAVIHERLESLASAKGSYFDLENYNETEYSQFDDPPQLSTVM